jgi:hypothetical protein
MKITNKEWRDLKKFIYKSVIGLTTKERNENNFILKTRLSGERRGMIDVVRKMNKIQRGK